MKTVHPDENNVVLNEKSVEGKPCINRESKSNEITIYVYSCYDINMMLLGVVTPSSIYQSGRGIRGAAGHQQPRSGRVAPGGQNPWSDHCR